LPERQSGDRDAVKDGGSQTSPASETIAEALSAESLCAESLRAETLRARSRIARLRDTQRHLAKHWRRGRTSDKLVVGRRRGGRRGEWPGRVVGRLGGVGH
jgi:hypothetical protein